MIDWAKLYNQGRCKAIGISWSEEELNAVYQLKIPAEYVRKGILTLKAYEKDKGSIVPLKPKEELMKEAIKEGINVTPDADSETISKLLKVKK